MRFDRLLSLRDAKILKASGVADDEIRKKTAFLDQLYADVEAAKSDAEVAPLVKARLDAAVAAKIISPASVDVLTRQLTSPWGREAFRYDPAPTLNKLTIPVLALNGSLDVFMPSAENLGLIRAALKDNPDATIVEIPHLNHAFQTVKLGTPYEGMEVEETFAPAALKIVGDWVAAHGK
jgi:pimeloyl-ACP methyl ester carboxylesterase